MLIKCLVSPTVCCKAITGTVNSNKLFFFKGSDCNVNSERTKDSLEFFFLLILFLTVMLSIYIETMTQRHRVKCFWEIWKCNISGSWFINFLMMPCECLTRKSFSQYHTITDTSPKVFLITGVAHVILTWLWGFLVIFLYLVWFSLCSSLFWECETMELWKTCNFAA